MSATATPAVAATAARPAKPAPRPPSSIQSYPFKDPDLDEAVGLMTKGLHLLKQGDNDEARGQFEQARDIFEAVTKKDYTASIKIFPPDAAKRQESLTRAQATKQAAETNLERCKAQIEKLNLPLKLKTEASNAKLEAAIFASVFGKEGLGDPAYTRDRERVFKELGIVEDESYRQTLIIAAQTLAEAIERSEFVLLPDDVLILSDHGINNDSLKLHDKTVAQWKNELIQKLQQPEEPSVSAKPSDRKPRRDRRAQNELAVPTRLSDAPRSTFEAQRAVGQPTVEAGAGDDTVKAGASDDTVKAGAGDDTVKAAASDDTLRAAANDDSTIPVKKNSLAVLLGEIYTATAVKQDEVTAPKAVLTNVDACLEKHGIPKDDQAFYLIKALANDGVITSEDELRTIALIASRSDIAKAIRENRFTHSEIDDGITNVLTCFKPNKNLACARWGQIFCEYIKSGYGSRFSDWYDRYHTETTRRATETALGTAMSGSAAKGTIPASDLRNVTLRIFQLLDLAHEEGVITETERKVVKTLLYKHDEFVHDYNELQSKKDQRTINEKIIEIAGKIERNYCGLGSKVRIHLIENGKHDPSHTFPLPTEYLSNLKTWLDLKNEYFQAYLDKSFPGNRGEKFDIKPSKPLSPPVDPSTTAPATSTQLPPAPLKQITLDDWRSIKFSHERPNGVKFLIAYFGLLEKDQLPTIETICRHTGFSKIDFDTIKKELIDTEFEKEGYAPLLVFPENSNEIFDIYFAYRKFKKDHADEDFTLDKLCELLNTKGKDDICKSLTERDFPQIITLDPSFSDVLIYLQLGVEDYERAQRAAKEDEELVKLVDAEAQVGTIKEVTVTENTTTPGANNEPKIVSVSAPFVTKLTDALVVADLLEANGNPINLNTVLELFDKLPERTRLQLLRFYNPVSSGKFPVVICYSNGHPEEKRTVNRSEYTELTSQLAVTK